MSISPKDRERLRELAKQRLDMANTPRNKALYQDWLDYGSSKDTRTMVRIELWTFEKDVLPAMMKCEGDQARAIERRILSPMANFSLFEDDTLVPPYYEVADRYRFVPFGLEVKRQMTDGVGHHFVPYLTDLESDDHLLGSSRFSVNPDAAAQDQRLAGELFGDILPVRRISNCLGACPTQDIVHIMNMDDMYIAMLDEEERFHHMMRRLTDDYLAFFRMIEEGGHTRSAARAQHLNQGSYCFTNELPDDKEAAKLKDCWLYMDSQEMSGASPSLFEEMVFPYYHELMKEFGLVSYGCCEATDPVWESCLSKVENLRKVSISPWCDEEKMGEYLRGTGITYLRKPPATLLGVGKDLDEDAVKACFRKTRAATKGCRVEIAQRDVYNINNTPDKVKRYVELIRQSMD